MTRGEAKRSRRGMLSRLKAVGYTALEMVGVVCGIVPVVQCLSRQLPERPDLLLPGDAPLEETPPSLLPAAPVLVRVSTLAFP